MTSVSLPEIEDDSEFLFTNTIAYKDPDITDVDILRFSQQLRQTSKLLRQDANRLRIQAKCLRNG